MGWAAFWATFSQTHLVTLVTTFTSLRFACEGVFWKLNAKNFNLHLLLLPEIEKLPSGNLF
jgi:hypothetical protein